jgi:hypothetical protein
VKLANLSLHQNFSDRSGKQFEDYYGNQYYRNPDDAQEAAGLFNPFCQNILLFRCPNEQQSSSEDESSRALQYAKIGLEDYR